MKWATRTGPHVDRTACAWLVRRFIDPDAEFVFVSDPSEVPPDATAFDMRGVALSHHDGECSFEAFLRRYELDDPVLWSIARIVHEADLEDERYDAPEAAGLDALMRPLDDPARPRRARRQRPALRRPLRVPAPSRRARSQMSDTAETTTRLEPTHEPQQSRTLRGLMRYFLKLGSSGFGGPIALVGYMQRDLVEDRRWYSEREFQQALAVGQTMPGPLAAQAAMWLGYLQAGARGALAVAVPFVLPPFLIVTTVAVVYAEYQGLSAVHAIFRGVGPAVLAIIAIASYKLARSTNKRDPVLWSIAAILCAATAISGAEIVWLFLLAGGFGAVYYGGGLPRLHRAASFAPFGPLAAVNGFAWTGTGASVGSMALFFAKAGRSRSGPAWRSCRSCTRGSSTSTTG